jgi:hypothetical protein
MLLRRWQRRRSYEEVEEENQKLKRLVQDLRLKRQAESFMTQ